MLLSQFWCLMCQISESSKVETLRPSVMVDPGLFGDFHKGNCTCNQMQSLYSTDCDNLPILYLVEPVFVPNVGICQSRQIVNIFPSDSRKPKIFTWNYIRMSPNAKFLSYVERSRSPKYNKSQFRWWSKDCNLQGYAPSFFPRVLEEMSRYVDPLK